MSLYGNKGEWSEAYAFLRLLADGKLFAADEQLNRIGNMFFPIMKIIRQETLGTPYEYCPNSDAGEIEIYLNDEHLLSLPAATFNMEASYLYEQIIRSKGTFEIKRTETFINSIYMEKLKAPSSDKSDINIQIHDVNTGFENIVGFSIKSELGSPPTLLNAGGTTNFVYDVAGLRAEHIAAINAINTRTKIIDRINAISDNGGQLIFEGMKNATFNDNLIMIDSQMPTIVAEMLYGYYIGIGSDCVKLADYVIEKDPLSRSADFYKHKIKEMLSAIALGMKPSAKWDGTDEASGGYIIVRTNGDVLAYHLYNRDSFKGYLLNNTKLEKGSTGKHGFGTLYQVGDKIKFNMNLQIRFT